MKWILEKGLEESMLVRELRQLQAVQRKANRNYGNGRRH